MKPLPMIPLPSPEPPSSSNGIGVTPDAEKTAELKPRIIEAISTVFDPEIPVNIWELGLIYDIAVDASNVAVVTMTLTAPGCPAAQSLPSEVTSKVKGVPGVADARVDVVWEPGWTKDRMSDVAK